jgi:DNA-directed RNA polymerase specialized sigma24 family protein
MITHINAKLNVWAIWVVGGRKVVGLGYPSQCAFSRLTPNATTLRSPIANEEAWEIEQAVHRLEAPLRDVVEQFYLRAGTVETHAKALGIGRTTLFTRIHDAHVSIMEWLQIGDDEIHLKKFLTSSDGFATKHVR